MTVLTPLPAAPSTADPTTFASRADAMIAALAVMVAEINAAGGVNVGNATTLLGNTWATPGGITANRVPYGDGASAVALTSPSFSFNGSVLEAPVFSGASLNVSGTAGIGNTGNSGIQCYVSGSGTRIHFLVDGTNGQPIYSGTNSQTYTSGENAGASALFLRKDSVTGRSLTSSGNNNASGADYAEYERKSASCGIVVKGQIIGFDVDGKITDKWADALSFGIKSTDPSYVGGDVWGNEEAIGLANPRPPGTAKGARDNRRRCKRRSEGSAPSRDGTICRSPRAIQCRLRAIHERESRVRCSVRSRAANRRPRRLRRQGARKRNGRRCRGLHRAGAGRRRDRRAACVACFDHVRTVSDCSRHRALDSS